MKIQTTLDDILTTKKPTTDNNAPDSYEVYKRKNGIQGFGGYADAVSALYATMKKAMTSYGANNSKINNKGLQNSGYAEYIDSIAKNNFNTGLDKIKSEYAKNESDARLRYAGYLDSYRDKQATVKRSVMRHLVKNDVVDLGTAIAYGMSAGLSREDAEAIGQSAYEITKERAFNSILEKTVSLGLDKEGARQLAIKMGISEADAQSFADEIGELLEYYGNISKEYLEFLEERSK